MKLQIEHKENVAQVLDYIQANVDQSLPFVPNLVFLGNSFGGYLKMFAAKIYTLRGAENEILGCSVRLITPNPAFADDEEVLSALAQQPNMRGVIRMLDFGGNEELRLFADKMAGGAQ